MRCRPSLKLTEMLFGRPCYLMFGVRGEERVCALAGGDCGSNVEGSKRCVGSVKQRGLT